MTLPNACFIANKLFVLNDLITLGNETVLALTKTGQKNMDQGLLMELCPKDCTFISVPRMFGWLEEEIRFSFSTVHLGRTDPF